MTASSASGSLHTKLIPARRIQIPQLLPWQMNSGECNRCHRERSTVESKAHFMLMPDAWKQAMNKLCHHFTMDSQWFDYVEGSVHAPDHVTQSLVASGAVPAAHADDVANALRRKIWQPGCPRDQRPFFLFKGGQNMSKYITFGCVHCQRATTLYSSIVDFMTHLRIYFP